MDKHTKEPWAHDGHGCIGSTASDQFNDNFFTAECYGPDRLDNARRIVACVNACADLPTESLEKIPARTGGPGFLAIAQDALQQRDELLTALKDAIEEIKALSTSDNSCEEVADVSHYEAIIAKAGGQ